MSIETYTPGIEYKVNPYNCTQIDWIDSEEANVITGTGFYIWKLADCLPVSRLIAALRRANATWVSIKVADGTYKYNQIREDGKWCGNDAFLLQVIAELREAGISVGGWHFIYPLPTMNPGAQAGVAGERYQKLHLDHLLIDAEQVTSEGALWKTSPDRVRSANTYMNQLRGAGVTLRQPVGLSSYRFPTLHREFPFNQFVNHESSNLIAPQMYWVGNHNPAAQLDRCIAEYDEVDSGIRPLIPIGAAYGAGSWEPTVADFVEFMAAVNDYSLPGCGFWSMDWILNHDRMDWLDAIGGGYVEPEPPAPPVDPPVEIPAQVEVTGLDEGENLKMRREIFGDVIGFTWDGARFDVQGQGVDDMGRPWYQVGKSIWIASWYTRPIP